MSTAAGPNPGTSGANGPVAARPAACRARWRVATFFPWPIHPRQRPTHGGPTHRQAASEFGQGGIRVLKDELFQASGGEPRPRTVSALQRLAVAGIVPAPEHLLHPTQADAKLIG